MATKRKPSMPTYASKHEITASKHEITAGKHWIIAPAMMELTENDWIAT
ncbi:MAG: hypothetical protein P8L85_19155 [Rubripirellula sp.]|nr:hypothetical protein [Rubripirellula sp.]